MSEGFDLSDEQIDMIVKGFFTQLPDFYDSIGIKPKKIPKPTKADFEEAREGLAKILGTLKTMSSYKEPAKTPQEALAVMDRFGREFGQIIGLPKGVNIFYYLYRFASAIINGPASAGYFRQSGYPKYRDTLLEISLQLNKNNLTQKAKNLLEEFKKSPDASVIAQSTFTRLLRDFGYLRNQKKKLEKRQVYKLVEIYSVMAGIYEKIIRIVVGFIEILDGKEANYNQLTKRRLALNIQQVGKKYPSLTRGFNINIRNSIAHTNYTLRLSNKTIRFIDVKSELTLTFREFFKECRSISCLISALMRLNEFMIFWQMKNAWEIYKYLKRQVGKNLR